MNRKLHFCSFLFCLSLAGYGQWLNNLTYNTAYYGENLTHPGIKIGAEHVYKYKMKEGRKFVRTDREEFTEHVMERRPFRQKGVRANVGFYFHRYNHTGFSVSAEIVKRRITRRKWTREFTAGLGYLRNMYFVPVYEVSDEGEVTKVPLPGEIIFLRNSPHFWGRIIR